MKRLLSLAISLIILGVIYWRIDIYGLARILAGCHAGWMVISLGMVVPLTLLTAWRLQQLMPRGTGLDWGEATRLILVASTLNMVLPSKMGDIAKAYFMKERGHLGGALSLSLVVFEKACDMISLLLWCLFGLLFYPVRDPLFWAMTSTVAVGLVFGLLFLGSRGFTGAFFRLGQRIEPRHLHSTFARFQEAWNEMHAYFWQERGLLHRVALMSVFIWSLHLLQIWLFILALRAWVPFLANLALSPLAILAGLLPLTFAGVGTRDAALIFFYHPHFSAPTAAALGLLCTARYLLPAVGGLPFLGQYLSALRSPRGL